MHNLPKRLKQLRNHFNLTQSAIAKAGGINRGAYQAYEEGRSLPPIPTAVKIADFYGITIDELVKGSKEPAKQLETLLARLTAKDRKAVEILLYG